MADGMVLLEDSAVAGVPSDLASALERAVRYLRSLQRADGYWWGELESNVTITAEHLLLMRFLGEDDPGREQRIATYLLDRQRADGAWAVWYGGPGDLNCTVEAYWALKWAGVSADDPRMVRARRFILERGGVAKTRFFTRLWMALFGQYPWELLPAMPPEVVLFPSRFPFNIYEFGSWARATIVPVLLVWHQRPVRACPEHARVDELWRHPAERARWPLRFTRPWASWRNFFLVADAAVRALERAGVRPLRRVAVRQAERWILARQERDGAWGGIQPPWAYSLIALSSLGYRNDHPVVRRGIDAFEGFAVDAGDSWHVQSCISPVWDTALAAIALRDAGVPADDPALVRAGRWLLSKQVRGGGDWQVKNRRGRPAGWAFEFENERYPDVDDAAIVLIALDLLADGLPGSEGARRDGLRWLLSMQDRNGGWAAFDVDNKKRFVTQIPFADFGETIDPPTEDVTAHVLELLGRLGMNEHDPAARRGLDFLWRLQDADGSWWGRWGVNHIYGIGAVLPALRALGADVSRVEVRRAVRWLEEHQNEDGGWGEGCESYADPSLRGRGSSTASQTAWALLALEAAGEARGASARRGVEYLARTQREDGSWDEPQFTGTGFPRDFMINYHLYRQYFPLMALGRIRGALERVGS